MIPEPDIYKQLLKAFEAQSKETANFDSLSGTLAQLSILSKAFTRPLFVLRTFGNNPLYFKRVKQDHTNSYRVKYKYKFKSFLNLLSLFLILLYICGYALLAYRLFKDQYQASTVPGSKRFVKYYLEPLKKY